MNEKVAIELAFDNQTDEVLDELKMLVSQLGLTAHKEAARAPVDMPILKFEAFIELALKDGSHRYFKINIVMYKTGELPPIGRIEETTQHQYRLHIEQKMADPNERKGWMRDDGSIDMKG
jgi:hypothetical protein